VDQVIDMSASFIIFIIALALIIQTTLPPPPASKTPKHQPPRITIKSSQIVSNKIVRIWIVSFGRDGKYTVAEMNTPAALPSAPFIVVFTGKRVVAVEGHPPPLTGYVYRGGLVAEEPSPPYVRLVDGSVVEVVDAP